MFVSEAIIRQLMESTSSDVFIGLSPMMYQHQVLEGDCRKSSASNTSCCWIVNEETFLGDVYYFNENYFVSKHRNGVKTLLSQHDNQTREL